ncbi:hypothetical protein [Photobacterium sanctipauli]
MPLALCGGRRRRKTR